MKILNKAQELFNTPPNEEKGESFEKFLEKCPFYTEGGIPHYHLKDLENYILLFERSKISTTSKKTPLDEINDEKIKSKIEHNIQARDKRKMNRQIAVWSKNHFMGGLPIEIPVTREDYATGIYVFGVNGEKPIIKEKKVENYRYNTNEFVPDDKMLKELGGSDENAFLSNDYLYQLKIKDQTYKSVTHYLLEQKVERQIKRTKDQSEYHLLVSLKEKIQNSPTSLEAHELLEKFQKDNDFLIKENQRQENNDLKRALIHKFIDSEGKLNSFGQKLQKTKGKKLYAGNEYGEWGMTFEYIGDNLRMSGNNRLGFYLDELRGFTENFESAN